MTNSEKLLSYFSEIYFYKELVYADLKFTPIGGTEIELADLIINLEDIILAIQLKERNEKDRTQDKNIEEKWLKKKCKKAKEQMKDTISYIGNADELRILPCSHSDHRRHRFGRYPKRYVPSQYSPQYCRLPTG